MRLNRRPKPDEPASDFVLQVGNNKIPVPAEKLAGRIDEEILAQAWDASQQNRNDQDKAIDTLMRMRQTLHDPQASTQTGQFTPWSPDNLYPTHNHQHQRSTSAQQSASLAPPQYPAEWDRRPSSNLPEPYDPGHNPTNCPASPNLADMPIRHRPTIFDGLGDIHHRRTSPPDEIRSRESISGKRTRKLRHLFPERSASALIASTSGRPRSGTGGSGKARRNHDFGDDVVQATKTNVRRPPKGIQNWFDGFISDDDEEEDEEDDEEEVGAATMQTIRQAIPPAQPQSEPQELPADDIAPPAYSNLVRAGSIASHWSGRSYTPGDDNPPPFNSGDVKTPMNRTQSVSTTADSLRSSHSRNTRHDSEGHLSRSRLASESVLALSDQSISEHNGGNHRRLPSLRDGTGDNQGVRLEDASRVDVRKYSLANHLSNGRAYSSDEITSAPRGSISHSHVSDPMYIHGNQSHYDLRTINPQDPNSVALHRLNGGPGFNMTDSRVSTSSSNKTFDMDNRTVQAGDSISNVPSDASHMMVVTDEERMLLDMMRRKGAAMQQVSFTEGYHLALRREHLNPIRRSASADSLAQEIVDQKENPSDITSHEIMRQKLSLLQKQDVDGALKMARFLGMNPSSQEEFAWPRDSVMPSTLPTSPLRNNSRSSEAYSPTHQERDSAYLTWSPQSAYGHSIDYQSKVPQYAEPISMSPTSVPAQRTSTQQHATPSQASEEEQIPDEQEHEQEQERGRQQANSPPAKRVSRSMDAVPVIRSTALHHRATFDTLPNNRASPVINKTVSPLHKLIVASNGPRRPAGADTPDSEAPPSNPLSKKTSKRGLPLSRVRDGGYNPRASITNNSAAEDVLAGWAELGGKR